MTNGDSAGFREKHCTCMRTACYRYDKQFTDTTDSNFHDRCSFPTRGNARLDTHTQRQAVTMNAAFDPWDTTPNDLVFSARYANFWGFLASRFWTDLRLYSSSASCKRWYGYRFGSRSHHKDQFLWQCHLVTQASPEVTNFLPKLQLSAVFHISKSTGKSKLHCLPASL